MRKSNRTDNESAKMATGKGVIQGYTGVAAVDARHQIIVEAQAHGTGSEQELLLPVVDGDAAAAARADTLITADAGYHSEANLHGARDARQSTGAHRRQRACASAMSASRRRTATSRGARSAARQVAAPTTPRVRSSARRLHV